MTQSTYPDMDMKCTPDGGECTIQTGQKAVSTAGTAVPLSDVPVIVWRIDLIADGTNSGAVFVGADGVNKDTLQAAPLRPGECYSIQCPSGAVMDLRLIYLDAEQDGDGVTFNYFQIA